MELRNGVGETVLHYLAVENCILEVEWLISQGADINSQTDFGDTPLINVAQLGYEEMTKLLLKHGAHVNHQNSNQETALFKAASSGRLTLCDALLAAGASPLLHDGLRNMLEVVPAEKTTEFAELLSQHGYSEEQVLQSLKWE